MTKQTRRKFTPEFKTKGKGRLFCDNLNLKY